MEKHFPILYDLRQKWLYSLTNQGRQAANPCFSTQSRPNHNHINLKTDGSHHHHPLHFSIRFAELEEFLHTLFINFFNKIIQKAYTFHMLEKYTLQFYRSEQRTPNPIKRNFFPTRTQYCQEHYNFYYKFLTNLRGGSCVTSHVYKLMQQSMSL